MGLALAALDAGRLGRFGASGPQRVLPAVVDVTEPTGLACDASIADADADTGAHPGTATDDADNGRARQAARHDRAGAPQTVRTASSHRTE